MARILGADEPNKQHDDFAAPGSSTTGQDQQTFGTGDILKTLTSMNSLTSSQSIAAFLKNLVNPEDSIKIGSQDVKLEVDTVRDYPMAAIIHNGTIGYLLVFQELIMVSTENSPPPGVIASFISKSLADKTTSSGTGNSYNLMNSLVVTPADYPRVMCLRDNIISIMRLMEMDIKRDYRGFMPGKDRPGNWTVVDYVGANPMLVNKWPSATLPCTDVSLVLLFEPAQQRDRYGNQIGQTINSMQGPLHLLSVGAYTEFFRINPQQSMMTAPTAWGQPNVVKTIQPVVHITSILSLLPVKEMLPLALSLASSQFVGESGQGTWRRPFTTEVSAGKPNVGNFHADPENPNKLLVMPDAANANEYINRTMMPPILVVDIADGTPMLPFMHKLGRTEDGADPYELYDAVASFTDKVIDRGSVPVPYAPMYRRMIGTYGTGGVRQDTRNVTYLNVVAATGASAEAERLLSIDTTRPEVNAANQMPFLRDKDVSWTAIADVLALNPEFMTRLVTEVKTSMQIRAADVGIGNSLNIGDWSKFSMTNNARVTSSGAAFGGRNWGSSGNYGGSTNF
jgi:hypothetical protein